MIEFGYDKGHSVGFINSDSNLLSEIREHFSIKNESAQFMRKYNRFIPQRTYAITPAGRFDACLIYEIKKFLLSKQYIGNIKIDNVLYDVIHPAKEKWHQSPKFTYDPLPLNLKLRNYQKEIVHKCLQIGRGTIVLATAGGKTLTAASLLTNIFHIYGQKFKCLFIVPDRGLVEQTYNDFIEYGVPFTLSKWTGDDKPDINANIIIANTGILQSKNTDLSWLQNIDVLFVDEVHKVRKGNEINKLFKHIKTHHRFGLTGTMPENLMDQWNIIGKIGPIIYEKHGYDLRQENYISGATIQVIKINYNKQNTSVKKNNATDRYRQEIETLITSNFRNSVINKIAAKVNKNILILVDYIKHGEILQQIISEKNYNKQIYFIRGDVEVSERDRVRKLMEEHDNIIVIAISKIFSTGINIKNLHYILFACGGKAKIKIVQAIGRGLRLHKDKEQLIIFDIADVYHYSQSHMVKRLSLYEKEKIKYTIKEIYE